MDRSIILMFWPGSSGLAWCSSNMVLCTIDWNAKLHRFGSSYISPWKNGETYNTPYTGIMIVYRWLLTSVSSPKSCGHARPATCVPVPWLGTRSGSRRTVPETLSFRCPRYPRRTRCTAGCSFCWRPCLLES